MGRKDAPAKKTKKKQRTDLKGPGVIKLAPRSGSPADCARVGLLSWSQRCTQDGGEWTENDLIESLSRVREQREIKADLILCSGVSFFSETNESDARTAQRITDASGGCPVLMEWPDEEGHSEWWLAQDEKWHLVRCDQYVKSANKVGSGGKLVLEEIEAGFGMLRVGKGPTMLLLICNEARILNRSATASAISPGVTQPPSGIPGIFSKDWVLLHPAHRPHAHRTHRRGWDLLGKTKVNGDGLFQSATSPKPSGLTRGPRVVLHAGPWQPGVDWQERASVSKFVSGARRRPKHPIKEEGLVEIRYAEFGV